MKLYYRVQPAGLDIKGHYSETSSGELADGLHVVEYAHQTFALEGFNYGDEVVVIEADEDWDNGDVEGVCIDPETSKVMARFAWGAWVRLWESVSGIQDIDASDLHGEQVEEWLEAIENLVRSEGK